MDPVTKYDVNLEKILRARIDKDFPNHMIIGEEFDKKKLSQNLNGF